MELNTGKELQNGKYRILGILGQGGFGITYLAEQTSLGRKVAIKEFFMKDLCNRDETSSFVSVPSVGSKDLVERFKQKFLKEARLIASFGNSHIIKIHDVFEENGTAYYVMEYLEGKSLSAIVNEQGIMSETLALKYIRQVADALAEVHANNLLHLDVKPANIMLNKKGEAVLIDFGISKHYDEAGNQTSSALIGTSEGYAPIEQYEAGALDSFTPATDIYALGATLFFLLTGTRPPKASEVMNYGLPELPSGISASVRSTIETAMQPAIAKRPQSIAEFLCLVESGKMQDESDGETVLNGNVKGENGKLKDESDGEAIIVSGNSSTLGSEKSHSANNEILRSAQNDNSANGRQNDKDGNEKAASKREGENLFTHTASESSFDEVKVERRNEKEHSAGAVISNESEKSQKNKPGKSLWLILLLLVVVVAGAWFLFSGTGNGDAPKTDTTKTIEKKVNVSTGENKSEVTIVRIYVTNQEEYFIQYGKGGPETVDNFEELSKNLLKYKQRENSICVILYADISVSENVKRKIVDVVQENGMDIKLATEETDTLYSEKQPLIPILEGASNNMTPSSDISDNELIQMAADGNNQSLGSAEGNVEFSLAGRKGVSLPTERVTVNGNCTVVVRIEVDPNGNVVDATRARGTDTSDPSALNAALRFAKKSKFSKTTGSENQYGTITYKFKVPDGAEVYIDDSLIGPTLEKSTTALNVTTTPSGAQVFIDNKSIGKTPIKGYEIPQGTHNIKITKEGYKDYNEKIEASAGPYVINETLEENLKPVASLTTGKHNGHDWVDLGLPSGLKWATCNVGASSPSDYGDYYAWGEISTKSSYDEYNSTTLGKKIGDIAGNPTYDVARAKWHGSWRLPTEKEFQELLYNCEWEWTTQDGHKGCKVTSKKNGNSIFLPAAGWRGRTSSGSPGSRCCYWSATPCESYADYACGFGFGEYDRSTTGFGFRYDGRSVRPVIDNGNARVEQSSERLSLRELEMQRDELVKQLKDTHSSLEVKEKERVKLLNAMRSTSDYNVLEKCDNELRLIDKEFSVLKKKEDELKDKLEMKNNEIYNYR